MKGGKGGQGRKRSSTRITEKPLERGGAKKGLPKRDWGAVPNDDTTPRATPTRDSPPRDNSPRDIAPRGSNSSTSARRP